MMAAGDGDRVDKKCGLKKNILYNTSQGVGRGLE